MTTKKFKFHEYCTQAREFENDMRKLLNGARDAKVRELFDDLESINADELMDAKKLTIAVVGQYNSGKSTIIKALTNIDVGIGSDVKTEVAEEIDWGDNIVIVDTPGICADFPEHDAITNKKIVESDLLIFTITNELFDNIIGNSFLSMCESKSSEILLVVNKMDQDSGTPEIKIPDINRITHPKTHIDYKTTFIDAKSYLDSLKESDVDLANEQEEISKFDTFISALNDFIREKELMGRLTTPLFKLRDIALKAKSIIIVENPDELEAIELLRRRKKILLDSKLRLDRILNGLLIGIKSDFTTYGDSIAVLVQPDADLGIISSKYEEAKSTLSDKTKQFQTDVLSEINSEFEELQTQLNGLENSELAQELKNKFTSLPKEVNSKVSLNGKSEIDKEEIYENDWVMNIKKTIIDKKILADLDIEITNENIYDAVYKGWKYLGGNFKPWQATKIANTIENTGEIIAKAGPIISIAFDLWEEFKRNENLKKLSESRKNIRNDFVESASVFEKEYNSLLSEFYNITYVNEIKKIDSITGEFNDKKTQRKKDKSTLEKFIENIDILIDEIQSQM